MLNAERAKNVHFVFQQFFFRFRVHQLKRVLFVNRNAEHVKNTIIINYDKSRNRYDGRAAVKLCFTMVVEFVQRSNYGTKRI